MTLGAALLVALFSQAAGGTAPESTVTSLRLDVQAPGACTSRGDSAARIAARSPRIAVVDSAPISARLAITLPRAGTAIADIVLAAGGVDQAPRRVTARSCAEAADGAALIIAVTLDPSLTSRHAQAPASSGAPVVETAPPVQTAPPAAPRPPRPAARRELGALVSGQTVFGAAPGVLPGLAIHGMAALNSGGPWAPALFLGAMRAWRSGVAVTGGAASFTLDAFTADACPLVLRWRLVAARPCASALVGRLAVQGANAPQSAPSD